MLYINNIIQNALINKYSNHVNDIKFSTSIVFIFPEKP